MMHATGQTVTQAPSRIHKSKITCVMLSSLILFLPLEVTQLAYPIYTWGMNPPKCNELDYIQFLITAQKVFSNTEAAQLLIGLIVAV